MQERKFRRIAPMFSPANMTEWLREWDRFAQNSLDAPGEKMECTENDSIFICEHLLFDPTVKAMRYKFQEVDGSETWRGDLLCENCIKKDVTELAKDGALVIMSYAELFDAMMEGQEA